MSSSSSASSLSPKIVSDALAAVASKDAKGSLAVLQQILAALLGGSADEAPPSSAAGGPPDSSATPGAKDTAGLSALLAAFKGAPAVNAELGATAQIKAVAAAFGVAVDDYAGMTAALEKAIKAAKTAPQASHLSADQLRICKEAGVDPAVFLAAKTRKIVLQQTDPRTGAATAQQSNQLTAEQLEICRATGVDPARFLAAKRNDSVSIQHDQGNGGSGGGYSRSR